MKCDEIDEMLVRSLVSAGVSLKVLENLDIVNFFDKAFNYKLKSYQAYRAGVLDKIVKEEKKKINEFFYNEEFSIMFDETTDINGNYILNVFGRILNNKPNKAILIDTIRLEKTNSDNILKEINFIIASLIHDPQNKRHLKFLIADGAYYCLKIGRIIKEDYKNTKHIVCACHNVSLLCEEVRKIYPKGNIFISEFKKLLVKNKSNQMLYFESTQLPLQNFP